MIASNVPGVVVDGVDMGDLESLGHGQSTEHVLLSWIHSGGISYPSQCCQIPKWQA